MSTPLWDCRRAVAWTPDVYAGVNFVTAVCCLPLVYCCRVHIPGSKLHRVRRVLPKDYQFSGFFDDLLL